MLGDKKEKRKYLREENYQSNLQQKSYLVGQIKDMIRNIGQGQKEIGNNKKKKKQEDKEQQKQ